MRKLIAFLLGLTMLLSLAACGKKEDDDASGGNSFGDSPAAVNTEPIPETVSIPESEPLDLTAVGYWEIIRIDSDNPDAAVSEEEVADAREEGILMYLELMEDGVGVFCVEDLNAILWNNDTITLVGGETFDYEIDGNRLSIDMEELTCVCRRAERPNSRISEMEDAGFTQFMEAWETYPYTTICSDDATKTTTGEATVIAYEIFESEEGYPAKEGYEWRVVTMEVRFFDKNAQKYGAHPFNRHEDYYDVKTHDDTDVALDESDTYNAYTQTRIYCGQEVETYVRISDSWSDWSKDANGNYECFYNIEFAYQVPEGYNGAVAGLEDGAYEYPEGTYITDLEPEYLLLFRLK